MTAPDTITREELAEALRIDFRGKASGDYMHIAEPYLTAAEIFEYVKAHREPEYEPGVMYEDAEGRPWQFVLTGGTGEPYWVRPGTVSTFAVGIPQRPLRKLVPEGSEAQMDGLDGEVLDELLKRAGLSGKQAAAVALDIHRTFFRGYQS